MKKIFPHLDNSIQDIYRKAVDGDEKITMLKKQGMAKYVSIFPKTTLFSTTDKTFLPYVSELSGDIKAFKQDPDNEARLTIILKKMEQLLGVLDALKHITKGSP